MRLDFNVLWVDDQPGPLDATAKAIALRMRDHGFDFQYKLVQSIEDVQRLVQDNVFADQIDLIMVDWDLGKDLKGQDVIAEIRQTIQYKDVIFYSSHASVPELREHSFNAGAEGVFCATKGGLVDEAIAVFETLVKKVLDLDHTRGIVMGATSDIDLMVVDCLAGVDAKSKEEVRAALVAKAKAIVVKRIGELQEKAKELDSAVNVGILLEAHALFTANDKLRVLNTAIKAAEYDGHASLRKGLGSYITDVVPMRNDLGHVVFIPTDTPGVLQALNGKRVTVENMRELRRTLLDLRADFRRLRDSLV